MLKRAFMSGLNAAGIDVLDLEVASVPVTRLLTRSPRALGGMTVRLDAGDPQSVTMRFFDTTGADVSEDVQRKIERLYQREDLRYVLAAEIGDIEFPHRAIEDYTAELQSIVDPALIADAGFKVVVDYSFGSTSVVMPNVLAKLHADVLAVNPYTSTAGMISFDRHAAARHVAALVTASGADLGAVLDADGERIVLVDDVGRVLTDTQTLLATVHLVRGHLLGDQIALPVNVTHVAHQLAEEGGIQVLPTKLSVPALMDASTMPGVGLAASGDGGFILPGFLPAYDAAAMLVKVLDLLARTGQKLSQVVDALPEVHMVHETLVTPWESKGMVMRSLVESAKDRSVVLVDGVKILYDEGWVLALPDPTEPITHLWAEGSTAPEAGRLASEYARRVAQLLR
jgi:mannose-1-phosphate guanylyltransferase/phosphomannomutase